MSQSDEPIVHIEDWGMSAYDEACLKQEQLVEKRLIGSGTDTLVLTQHPPTVTLGRRGSSSDLRCAESSFAGRRVALHRINRGGLATAHEPGQLVVYPVLKLKERDLRYFTTGLLSVVVKLLADFGLKGELKAGNPGVWVGGRKICSFGIALRRWVTYHGAALNLNNDLSTFELIVPCGVATEKVTSLMSETGQCTDIEQVKKAFVHYFCGHFGYRPIDIVKNQQQIQG